MSFRLFPQLPLRIASELASSHGSRPIHELRELASSHHEQQVFSATGGHQVSHSFLEGFAEKVRALCEGRKPGEIDTPLARLAHTELKLSRLEASNDGIWSFFGCVLLPDVVRWRFHGEVTPPDRFLGKQRGLRTLIGRAWWRAEMLLDESPPPGRDPFWLLDELAEDEILGIVERPRAVATRRVAVALGRGLLETKCGDLPRALVAREAVKTFLRLGYFVEFDTMTDEELRVACQSQYRRAVMALKQS